MTNLPYRTLIDAPTLLGLQRRGTPLLLLDCGFDLTDTEAGEREHVAGHLPGAHYLHLERDLSGPQRDNGGRFLGRHPLPAREALSATMASLGLTPATQVVAYDAQGGCFAARAWWLLRWLGHEAVAVLDGGRQAWAAAGGPLTAERSESPASAPELTETAPAMPTIEGAELLAGLGRLRVLDARAPERFRGEVEPLDAVAGHVPGATNRFFKLNLQADGCFKPAAQLREELRPLLGGTDPAQLVQQCGSGVTACHNLLAFEQAGLHGSRLYPGSWSEWCADPARPVARA